MHEAGHFLGVADGTWGLIIGGLLGWGLGYGVVTLIRKFFRRGEDDD